MKLLSYNEFLYETSGSHDFGCVMLYFDTPEWPKLLKSIDNDDVYTANGFGKEQDQHVTILYGLHSDISDDQIKDFMLKNFSKPTFTLEKINLFESDDFDVVKLDIKSKELTEMNKMLTDNFPYTSDFPEYKAHSTLAYVLPGKGEKYAKTLKEPIIVKPNKIVYSKVNGEKQSYDFKK